MQLQLVASTGVKKVPRRENGPRHVSKHAVLRTSGHTELDSPAPVDFGSTSRARCFAEMVSGCACLMTLNQQSKQ